MTEGRRSELTLVGNNVRVRTCGRDKIIVADLLADPRPGHTGQVHQADTPVPKAMR
jgi:hypothetical protein